MASRVPLQMLSFFGAALVAGTISNATRSHRLAWRGGDPDLLRYPKVKSITIAEAISLHDQATTLFLDARPKRDFEAEHVRGAVSFSADDLGAAFEELRDFLGADVTLVVYGQETLPAVRAVEFLAQRGHEARVLEGGWRAWKTRGLATETGAPGGGTSP
jgi:rhodanese-related sulfurtransferase